MKLKEFKEQDIYCRKHNVPEGKGCSECPAEDKEHCSDALRNLCDKWLKSKGDELNKVSGEMDRLYGITPFNQLELTKGILEFPE